MTEKENAGLAHDAEAAEIADSWLLVVSREFGRTFRLGKNGIDLLVDATGGALNTTKTITKKIVKLPRRDRKLSSTEEALFGELGSKVAECPGGDYLSLQYDARFWELVKQLHAIRGKVGKEAVAEGEPAQDQTSDSPTENSGSAGEIPEVTPEKQDAPEGAVAEEPKTAKPPTED